MNNLDLNELVSEIETTLGKKRLEGLKRNPDNYQNFWLSILENIDKAVEGRDTHNNEIIPYLITKGYFDVKHALVQEGRRRYVAYCPKCGKYHPYTYLECPKCHVSLRYLGRHKNMDTKNGFKPSWEDRDTTMDITIKDFVNSLTNESDRYVAQRWMIDRLDLKVVNYQKQISYEMGVCQTNIARRVIRLKKAFQIWYRV
jgi:hypothetical protein